MDPGPADAPADVLPRRNLLPAASALLVGGTRRVIVHPRHDGGWLAEPDRAGAGYGKAGAPRAEMRQMRVTHPLVDLHSLHPAP